MILNIDLKVKVFMSKNFDQYFIRHSFFVKLIAIASVTLKVEIDWSMEYQFGCLRLLVVEFLDPKKLGLMVMFLP